jgi:outer membrane lipoprotein-sorting protein
MIRSHRAAWVLMPLLAAAPLLAQDARETLLRHLERGGGATFAGLQTTVVTTDGKTRRTEQVVKRRGSSKLRIEYLAPPRLKGELVVDDGESFRHYIPALRVMEEGPSRLQRSLKHQTERLRSLQPGEATVSVGGEETLLGRKVTIFSIVPAQPDKRTRVFWVDHATGLPLRIEEKGRDRTSVTIFQRIDFSPVLGDAEFQLPVPAGVTVVPARLGRPISFEHAERMARRFWGGMPVPTALPAGYQLTSVHQLNFRRRPVIALRYTRGKDDLSLFVSGATEEPFAAPVKPRLNVVQRPVGGVLVTLVGSLPTTELQRIAASLH